MLDLRSRVALWVLVLREAAVGWFPYVGYYHPQKHRPLAR